MNPQAPSHIVTLFFLTALVKVHASTQQKLVASVGSYGDLELPSPLPEDGAMFRMRAGYDDSDYAIGAYDAGDADYSGSYYNDDYYQQLGASESSGSYNDEYYEQLGASESSDSYNDEYYQQLGASESSDSYNDDYYQQLGASESSDSYYNETSKPTCCDIANEACDQCLGAVTWAKTFGIVSSPEWYKTEGECSGLTPNSTWNEFHQYLFCTESEHDDVIQCKKPPCPELVPTPTTTTTTMKAKPPTRYPYDFTPEACKATLVTTSMTNADYDRIIELVRTQLRGIDDKCDATDCPQADWAGCVLRLAGHDFMDFRNNSTHKGGSDGCIDFNDADNKGLEPCLHAGEFSESLMDSYENVCDHTSLADFIVIAAQAVMTETRTRAKGNATLDFKSGFRFGRTTSKTCPDSTGRLPNPERGCTATGEVFIEAMGLDWTQAAALMGVHTLGRAKTENSGYNGWWSDPENSRTFNNNYFAAMLSKSWTPVENSKGKFQWNREDIGKNKTGTRHEMMLNTDICLAFDIEPASEPTMQTGCKCLWLLSENFNDVILANEIQKDWCGGAAGGAGGFSTDLRHCCPSGGGSCDNIATPTGKAAEAVHTFAADETKWITSFTGAWKKAIENGFEGLTALSP